MQKNRKQIIGIGVACLLLVCVLAVCVPGYSLVTQIFHSRVAVVEPDEQEMAMIAASAMQEKPELQLPKKEIDVAKVSLAFTQPQVSGENAPNIPSAIYQRDKIAKEVDNILLVLDGSFYLVSCRGEELQLVAMDPLLLLPVQGYGWTSLADCYGLGGLACVANTLNQALDLDIEQYMFLNSEALWQVADRMGGLTVELSAAEADELNRLLGTVYTAGETVMWTGGLQVYTKLTVDGDAISHWRSACNAMIDKAKTENRTRQLLKALSHNASANVSWKRFREISKALLGEREIEQQTFPRNGAYKLLEGEWVLEADLETEKVRLHRLLYS